MKIYTAACPYPLGKAFVSILDTEVEKSGESTESGIVVTFCDDNYDPEKGGWHPVEVRISPDGTIEYVTDLAYVGTSPCAELAKEIDFNFSLGLFQHFGREHPLEEGRDLFTLWQTNFVAYYEMGIYLVLVTTDADLELGQKDPEVTRKGVVPSADDSSKGS